MANLRGKGATTDVNLIAYGYDNAVTDNGSRFLDVQVDHRDKGAENTKNNLHLSTKTVEYQGKQRTDNGQAYSRGQVQQMINAAGGNTQPMHDSNGKVVGQSIAFKGSLQSASNQAGFIVATTKPMGPSDFKLEPGTQDQQYVTMQEGKAERLQEEAKEAAQEPTIKAEAPDPWGQQAEVVEAEVVDDQEPAIG